LTILRYGLKKNEDLFNIKVRSTLINMVEANSLETNPKISDLWEYATPLKNNENIGYVDYLGYRGLIVIKEFTRE
jgi:hypothetical protein